MEQIEKITFLVSPQPGDKIKVYNKNDGGINNCYGSWYGIVVKTDFKKVIKEGQPKLLEMVVVDKKDIIFAEPDFYFSDSRCITKEQYDITNGFF